MSLMSLVKSCDETFSRADRHREEKRKRATQHEDAAKGSHVWRGEPSSCLLVRPSRRVEILYCFLDIVRNNNLFLRVQVVGLLGENEVSRAVGCSVTIIGNIYDHRLWCRGWGWSWVAAEFERDGCVPGTALPDEVDAAGLAFPAATFPFPLPLALI